MFQFCFRPWAADIRKLIGHMCEEPDKHGVIRTVRKTSGALGGRVTPDTELSVPRG